MEKSEQVKYWITSSEEDWLTALEIAQKNERKHMSLFLGHLSLEKLFKALFVKKFYMTPPYKHDLAIFAQKCELDLSNEILSDLKLVNEFNIQTRYPDYKNDFYKRCTPDFINTELSKIERLREWIKNIIENMP